MSNPLSPITSDTDTPVLDTSITPLGERALQHILDYVVAVGDEAETTYLETKGPLTIEAKSTAAKIAKFLLGTANRLPLQAARHFQGHAVLVIGARKGDAPGVPRGTEAHDLENRLQLYLGPQFPTFEFGRITVSADQEVLFIIAQPPKDGQSIFPCHKDFHDSDKHKKQDNLTDGAIYVRGTSNTRPADSGDVLALVERARGGGKPPITLEVELIGRVHRVDHIEELLGRLRTIKEMEFNEEQNRLETTYPDYRQISAGRYALANQRPLSKEDREGALVAWRGKKAEHITEGRKHFLGAGLSGAGIRVLSRGRFVAKPHLILTFHGCEVLGHIHLDDAEFEKVSEPVLRRQPPWATGIDYSAVLATPPVYPVTYNNQGENAEIVLTPESFRPDVPWTNGQDDYVILSRDPQASSVEVSWTLTEDGNDATTTGEFRVPTGEHMEAANLLKWVF